MVIVTCGQQQCTALFKQSPGCMFHRLLCLCSLSCFYVFGSILSRVTFGSVSAGDLNWPAWQT
jgi:hypothetical protein